VDLLDFSGRNVVEALRELLSSFRLPGESPLIERIVTTFSEHYMEKAKPEGIADQDALYILTYAVIMLVSLPQLDHGISEANTHLEHRSFQSQCEATKPHVISCFCKEFAGCQWRW
jgi:hypothetical protein